MIRAILLRYHAWRMKRAVRKQVRAEKEFTRHYIEWHALRNRDRPCQGRE